MSHIKQRKTPDEGVRTLKRRPHQTKDEFSEVLKRGKKTRGDENFKGTIYFQLLGFDFKHGKIAEKFGNLRGAERRFCFDLSHFFQKEKDSIAGDDINTTLPGQKLNDKGYHEQYQIAISYNNNQIQTLSILREGKNFNKAGQRVIAGVDISPGYSQNISGEYAKNNNGNLVLQTFRKGAQTIWDQEHGWHIKVAETALVSSDFSFILPQAIMHQNNYFTINHIGSDEPLIRFPGNLII